MERALPLDLPVRQLRHQPQVLQSSGSESQPCAPSTLHPRAQPQPCLWLSSRLLPALSLTWFWLPHPRRRWSSRTPRTRSAEGLVLAAWCSPLPSGHPLPQTALWLLGKKLWKKNNFICIFKLSLALQTCILFTDRLTHVNIFCHTTKLKE